MIRNMTSLSGKNVLVTGGTGSIGEAIARKALIDGSKTVKILSNDENAEYEMEMKMEMEFGKKSKNLIFLLGDIRDEDRVNSVMKDVNIVFHAAALKHVDRSELNPFEAINTNILGTKNIIQASLKEGIKKVISISTDKAVNPVGVMGCSKLLAEKLIAAESLLQNSKTIFTSVRFGNVLNTRGSVLPRIEKQIQHGGPITLTDERMQRYFMTKQEAVNLIISASELAKGGEIFVLKMPILRLKDLFEVMKKLLAPKYGFKTSQIKTRITGMKYGEKLIEDLLNEFEAERVLETKDFFILPPLLRKNRKRINYLGAKKPMNVKSYLKNQKPLNQKQIFNMLKKIY